MVSEQPHGEIPGQRLGIGFGILVPLGPEHFIEVLVIEGLLLLTADSIEQFDERAREGACRTGHQ